MPDMPMGVAPGAGVPDEAQRRILRIMTVVFAIAAVVFGLLLLPTIAVQTPLMSGWWSLAALLGLFATPVAMAVFAPWSGVSAIKRWTAAIAIVQLLVMATWVAFMSVPALPASASSPWVLGVTAIGTSAAAMAWRARYVVVYLVATAVLVVLDRSLTAAVPVAIPYQDALYSLTFSAVFAALAGVCVATGAELDRAAAAAQHETALEAAHRAEHRQLTRVNALLHDRVLATLLVAAHGRPGLERIAREQARATLEQIDRFESPTRPMATPSGRDVVWRFQAITTELDPDAHFSYEIDPHEVRIDADVVRALEEGVAEALRNVARHAAVPDREVHRAVHVEVTGHRVRVDVLDDGRGFDPSAVSPTRLGIAVSIRNRMASIVGGSSTVVSVPGQGTRVVLEWHDR